MKNRKYSKYTFQPKEKKPSEYFEPHNFPYFCEYELHFYAERANYEVLKTLLDEFPMYVNCVNSQGYTPLAIVTKTIWELHTKEEKKIMELLLACGADPMMNHFDGQPIAMHAFKNGDAEVMMIFAKYLDDIDTYFEGYTPLHYAVTQCEKELAKYCLDRNANVHQMYPPNMTLVHVAMVTHNYAMVPLLLEYGCDVNAKMADGNTALHMAAVYNNSETVVRSLIDYNADVNCQNDLGDTPLNRIAQQQYFNFDTFQILLKSRCNVNIPDFNGLTPLHKISYGFKFGKYDKKFKSSCKNFVIDLLRRGANVFAISHYGETVVDTALRNNRMEIAEILIKNITPRWVGRYQENDPMFYSFEKHPKFRSIAKKCMDELSKLSAEIPGTNFSYKDLASNYRRVVKSATDKTVADEISQTITRRSRLVDDTLVVECQKVLDLAKMLILLTEIFEYTLPEPCIDKILEYITPQDCVQTFRPRINSKRVSKKPKGRRYYASKTYYY